MDDRACALGNRLLGNAEGDAALKSPLNGPTHNLIPPTFRRWSAAPLAVTLDGTSRWTTYSLFPAGATLKTGGR